MLRMYVLPLHGRAYITVKKGHGRPADAHVQGQGALRRNRGRRAQARRTWGARGGAASPRARAFTSNMLFCFSTLLFSFFAFHFSLFPSFYLLSFLLFSIPFFPGKLFVTFNVQGVHYTAKFSFRYMPERSDLKLNLSSIDEKRARRALVLLEDSFQGSRGGYNPPRNVTVVKSYRYGSLPLNLSRHWSALGTHIS